MDRPRQIYEFEGFNIDAERRLLTAGTGETVRLTPKAFDTLLYLVRHRDDFSSREHLLKTLWPKRVVEDNNLDQNISALRRALGDRSDKQRYIVTVPGKGYRFVAEVTVRSAAARAAEDARPAIRSMAVLPFKPLVPQMRDLALELGMADTLIARLSNLRELIVRPLAAVQGFSALDQDPVDAGRDLAVDAVLEGHLQRSGDTVRTTVRLVRIVDGSTLWASTLDTPFGDIFALQDMIAGHVVDAMTIRMDTEERTRLVKHGTDNPAAYAHYLKGRFYWWKIASGEFGKCRDHFEQAVAADPDYALGYCGLNSYYGFGAAWGFLPADDAWPRAEAAIAKALVLDDRLAEAHTGLAALKLVYYRDWVGAERAAQRALALNPGFDEIHYLYSFLLLAAGRFREAIVEGERALAIDPFSPRMNESLGNCLYFAGRYEDAIRQYQHTLEFDPSNLTARESLGDAFHRAGMPAEAVAEWAAVMRGTGDDDLAAVLAAEWARNGVREAVRAVARRRLERMNAPAAGGRGAMAASLAREHAKAGNVEKALDCVERASEERNVFALLIAGDPVFTEIRPEARFARCVARVRRADAAPPATVAG